MSLTNLPFHFSLVVLSCLATVSGAFETISACFVDEYPRLRQYKPAIAFTALVIAFLVNLALATQVTFSQILFSVCWTVMCLRQ